MGSDDPYFNLTKKDPGIDDCDGGEVCFSFLDCLIIGLIGGISIAWLLKRFVF